MFISIGLKGGDKTSKELKNVGGTLGELKTSALALKASFIAAAYVVANMMSSYMRMGLGLTQFNSLTNLSTLGLQQWQNAARQAGVGADEMTDSIKNVQSAMAKVALGEGAPKGLTLLQRETGLEQKDFQNTFKVMEHLQMLAQKLPKGAIGNEFLKSFGLSEKVIGAMRAGAFTEGSANFKRGGIYTEKQIKDLEKAQIMWDNMVADIKFSLGNLFAKDGPKIVKIIGDLIKIFIKFESTLIKVMPQLNDILGKVGHFIEWLLMLISTSLDTFNKDYDKKKEEASKNGKETSGTDIISEVMGDITGYNEKIKNIKKEAGVDVNKNLKDLSPAESAKVTYALKKDLDKEIDKQLFKTQLGQWAARKDIALDDWLYSINAISKKTHEEGLLSTKEERAAVIAPKMTQMRPNVNNNVKVDQHFSHPGKEAPKLRESTRSGITETFIQIPYMQGN